MKIEPGTELDRAVARAIGRSNRQQCDFKRHGEGGWEGSLYRCKNCSDVIWDDGSDLVQDCIPCFSTDLNAAFAAADVVNLFTPEENTKGQGPWMSLEYGPLGWVVMSDETCTGRGQGDSPALAICAAILKFKRSQGNENNTRRKIQQT